MDDNDAAPRLCPCDRLVSAASLIVFAAAPAFAQDDEQPDETEGMSFEQSLIHQLLTGLGAVGATSNKGINYRERSPLVLPPSNDLPTPQPRVTARAPNWPKDPDEMERAAAAAAAKQARRCTEEAARAADADRTRERPQQAPRSRRHSPAGRAWAIRAACRRPNSATRAGCSAAS